MNDLLGVVKVRSRCISSIFVLRWLSAENVCLNPSVPFTQCGVSLVEPRDTSEDESGTTQVINLRNVSVYRMDMMREFQGLEDLLVQEMWSWEFLLLRNPRLISIWKDSSRKSPPSRSVEHAQPK